MTSPTQWTWVWASSGRWWRTEKPGLLQSIGWQRVGHNWVTEQKQQYHTKSITLEKNIIIPIWNETILTAIIGLKKKKKHDLLLENTHLKLVIINMLTVITVWLSHGEPQQKHAWSWTSWVSTGCTGGGSHNGVPRALKRLIIWFKV